MNQPIRINNFDDVLQIARTQSGTLHRGTYGALDCNYSGQARKPRLSGYWNVAPGETFKADRCCKKCFPAWTLEAIPFIEEVK